MSKNTENKKKVTGRRILDDHRKVGKKYIPPMAEIGFNEITWIRDILPEVIWIALIIEKFELERAIDLVGEFTKIVTSLCSSDPVPVLAFTTNFKALSDEDKIKVISKLKVDYYYDDLLEAVGPLLAIYPECPLSFIMGGKDAHYLQEELNVVKDAISKCTDKFSHAANLIQASVVYIACINEKCFFTENVTAPDLEEIASNPESEKAQRSASMCRTIIMMMCAKAHDDYSKNWVRYFWNRGYAVDECY